MIGTRVLLLGWLAAQTACGPLPVGETFVPVKTERSLFWVDPVLLDDPQLVSFAKVMAIISADGHGGKLLEAWFQRFGSTAHSERSLPSQFVDGIAAAQGTDPSKWALGGLPFVVTGVHNRIDLASYGAGGHCGELRVSIASRDVTLQPFHMLFLFRQPALADDTDAAGVHCRGTARRWAELSRLEGDALRSSVRAHFRVGFTRERFLLAETVEFTLAPWEWRQWLPDAAGVLENPPLFQQVNVEKLNLAGPARDEFLGWVKDNAPALVARTLLIPEKYRTQSVRVTQGVVRPPLSLAGLDAQVAARFPQLRQQIELVGCAVCHTADADFVQTRTDRTPSRFYEKELLARERHLEKLVRGEKPKAPFGPLQSLPVLPQ